MEDKDLIELIKREITHSPEKYPFIASTWEVSVYNYLEPKVAKYGTHQTNSNLTKPHYKPISKMFDLLKMEQDDK